jgi:hypothetical protein
VRDRRWHGSHAWHDFSAELIESGKGRRGQFDENEAAPYRFRPGGGAPGGIARRTAAPSRLQIEGEHGFGKPEERAYNHAMEVLGVGPHETWMVGDNLEWEIMAPQRLGIYAIWHDGYGVGLPPNSPIRPDRIIRRMSLL